VSAFPRSLSDRLIDRYEDLRRQAKGEWGDRAGMVVFLRQGMRAWMTAWPKWTTSEVTEPSAVRGDLGNLLPPKVRDEITLVLAGMALCGNIHRYPETDAQGVIRGIGAITA
jgi:hypothetical protein